MTTKIGINGFGRIGRCVTRIALNDPDVELVGINDLADHDQLAHLFKRDTVHGTYPEEVEATDGAIRVGDREIRVTSASDPSELPWDELDVDIALESTGVFRKKKDAARHLDAGADNVIISAPGKGVDFSLCMGVNQDEYDPNLEIIDIASCTTNCLAPVAKVLHESFGIKRGWMTTIHAYTNDQPSHDMPHKDLRRARAAAQSIIPTTTGAARAVGKVLPDLSGKLDGFAMRVPVIDGSVVDLVAELDKNATVDSINDAMKKAANGPLKGVLEYCEDPIVSCDIIGNPASSIFDSQLTMIMDGNFCKVVSWYDNEWGYSARCVDLFRKMMG